MSLTGKDRAELRAEAHHLAALVHVGHQGLTPTVIGALEDALRTRELVKVQLAKQLEPKPKDTAQALALATGASIVQVIGRTVTLFRENPELERKPDQAPPWKR